MYWSKLQVSETTATETNKSNNEKSLLYLRGETMKKQRNHQEVYVLKVTVPVYGRPDPSRTIAIVGKSTLYTFAMVILRAFNFDADHLFGFYNNLKNWTKSDEEYTYDTENWFSEFIRSIDGSEKPIDVKKAKIKNVFTRKGKKMLFLYDFGDKWHFTVKLIERKPREEGKRCPAVIEREGKAPQQYWYPDEDEMTETTGKRD